MKKKPKRTPKQILVLQIIWGILAISVFAGISYGVWYTTRLPEQAISTITVSGAETVSADVVIELAESALEGTYAGLIPKRFKYMYPAHEVRKLVQTIPQIKELDIIREEQTLKISFSEYHPYALWCDEAFGRCLQIDSEGYAFMEAPKLSGTTFMRFVIEDEVMVLDKTMLKPERLHKFIELSQLFEVNFGFEVVAITVKNTGDVEYTLQGEGALYTAGAAENQETLENLSTILESEEFAHLQPDNFKYIDLRFGNRVYINEEIELPEITASSSTTTTEAAEM